MKKNTTIFYLVLSGIILIVSACGNHGGNGNPVNQNPDSLANAQAAKGVTVKERQHFHTQAQRSIDSMQRVIDKTDRAVKRWGNGSRQKWDITRDSLRRILDHANRKLNNQAYKSDDEWKSVEATVNVAIDSVAVGLKKEEK